MPRHRKGPEPADRPIRRTIDEYCKANPGLNKRTIYRLAKKNKIRLVKFGGAGRLFVEETEETVEPVIPGEHSKAVQAMLAARKAKA